jgi:hypothetical protein
VGPSHRLTAWSSRQQQDRLPCLIRAGGLLTGGFHVTELAVSSTAVLRIISIVGVRSTTTRGIALECTRQLGEVSARHARPTIPKGTDPDSGDSQQA